MSAHRPSFWRVLSDTSRVLHARSRHFLALSLLFLYPVSFVTIIYPLLLQPTSVHSYYRRLLSYVAAPDSATPSVGKPQHLNQVLYVLFVVLFNLFSIPAITRSTFSGFYGRPVRFISSFKSILVSFLPLLATMLLTKIILGLILFAAAIFMLLPYTGLTLLGFDMQYGSVYFLVFVVLFTALFMGLLIYLQIEWYLTTVVVVVESQWGITPLKRSSYLVKGMRWIVFFMMLFFEVLSGLLSIWYSSLVANAGRTNDGCIGWWAVLLMVVYTGFSAILSLYSLAAKTVLFVYCKALHGELAFQIDEKLGGEYVPLRFDAVDVV